MNLAHKHKEMQAMLRPLGSVLVAFSGGVDSSLVLAVSKAVLGKRVLAVTAASPSVSDRELAASRAIARELGVEHQIVNTREMDNPKYRENPVNRCFYCKSELYSALRALADARGFASVVNGINKDDLGDHRPGIAAAKEAGVLSPLAGFCKPEVRELARRIGLSVWKKPAMPCLSSRVPYGTPISTETLSMIERAEDLLFSLGFSQLRVRHLGDTARIELEKREMPRYHTGQIADTVRRRFAEIGFKHVTLDPEGFRSGRLNEGIAGTGKG